MILRFLKTKTGLSLFFAVVFVIGALILKTSQTLPSNELKNTVALIADTSIQNALKNGTSTTAGWENSLKIIAGEPDATTSTNPSTSSGQAEEKLTATDILSRNLFAEYVKAKQAGQEVDDNLSQSIANEVLSQDYTKITPIFTEKDIRTVKSDTTTSLRLYGNDLARIITAPIPEGEQEVAIFMKLQTETLEKYVGDLKTRLLRYENMEKNLLNLVTPIGNVSGKLKILNGIHLFKEAVAGALTMETDPVGALVKITGYEDGVNLVNAGLVETKAFFISKNIIFPLQERAYVLTK